MGAVINQSLSAELWIWQRAREKKFWFVHVGEDLFQEILSHTVPDIHAMECKFLLFSCLFYVLKTN